MIKQLLERSLVRRIIVAGGFCLVGSVVGVLVVVYYLSLTIPAIGPLLKGYQPLQTTRILASDGEILGEMYEERRTVVPLEQIPDIMVLEIRHNYVKSGLLELFQGTFCRKCGLDAEVAAKIVAKQFQADKD